MSAFTPGPWLVVPYGDGDSLVIHSDDENRVCFMATHGGARSQWERIQANAALIAAAPDLYEALAALDADWTEACPGGPDNPKLPIGTMAERTVEIWRKARAALSAARGETSRG